MNKLAKCSVFFVLCFSIFAFFSCSNVQYNGNSCTVRIDIPAEIPGEVLTPEEYVFDFELKNSGATVYKTGHAGETVYFYVAPGAVSFKCSVISVSNSKILYYGTKNTSIIFGMNAVIDFDLVKVKDDSGDPSDPDPDPARSSDYSTAKVGDIILSDGTILKKDATYDSSTMTAVAIIVREKGAKPAMGMGIYNAKAERETNSFGKEMSTTVCWYGSSYSGGIGDYITRQDMTVMLKRAAEYAGMSFEDADNIIFSDADEISEYAKSAISAMKKAGVINGVTPDTFEPLSNANRAQAAKVIFELLNL